MIIDVDLEVDVDIRIGSDIDIEMFVDVDIKVMSRHVKVTAKVVVNVTFIVIFAALFTTSLMNLSLKCDNYQCKIGKKNLFGIQGCCRHWLKIKSKLSNKTVFIVLSSLVSL